MSIYKSEITNHYMLEKNKNKKTYPHNNKRGKRKRKARGKRSI